MLKYEKKLHFDKYNNMLQSNNIFLKMIKLLWGVIVYLLLYYVFKSLFHYIPDIQPWNDTDSLFYLDELNITEADLLYFIAGLIINCYGSLRLSTITFQNHQARGKDITPKTLLTNGYYAKVRHPMYGTFIILQAGFMISLRSLDGLLIALLIIIMQYINAKTEENRQLKPLFGDAYTQYSKDVKCVLFTKTESAILLIIFILSITGFIV